MGIGSCGPTGPRSNENQFHLQFSQLFAEQSDLVGVGLARLGQFSTQSFGLAVQAPNLSGVVCAEGSKPSLNVLLGAVQFGRMLHGERGLEVFVYGREGDTGSERPVPNASGSGSSWQI